MPLEGCELYAEVRYGEELSFEEVGRLEALLRVSLPEAMAGLFPSYLDIRTGGDGLAFVSSVPAVHPDELRDLCGRLGALMGMGAHGRLVVVGHGFGPVFLWRFTCDSLEETEVGARR